MRVEVKESETMGVSRVSYDFLLLFGLHCLTTNNKGLFG